MRRARWVVSERRGRGYVAGGERRRICFVEVPISEHTVRSFLRSPGAEKRRGMRNSDYINKQPPMPPPIDNKPVPQTPVRNEPFMDHLRQKHNHGIIVSLPRHIHRDFNPCILPRPLALLH